MKKTIIIMAMAGIVFAACDKKDEGGFQWRPNDLFPIQGVDQPTKIATARGTLKYANGQQQRMTAKEVTKRYLEIYPDVAWHTTNDEGSKGYLGVPPEYVDTANARFMMASGYIIWEDGSIGKDFIYNYDNYFVDTHTGDTIAYIPNSAIESARERIIELHAQERYEEIYELFQNAFVFYPCTGEEYKQLVLQGVQGEYAQALLKEWLKWKERMEKGEMGWISYEDFVRYYWPETEAYKQLVANGGN